MTNTTLQVFEYITEKSDSIVRVYGTQEAPLFMAKDVAVILGYRNPREAIRTHVDIEDCVQVEIKRGSDSLPLPNQPQSVLINESGLYSLIIRSKKPQAKKFKRWITSEVLPQIRKTGGYVQGPAQGPAQGPVQGSEQGSEQKRLAYIKVLDAYSNLMEKIGGMDDRDKILVRDLAKNVVTDNKSGIKEIEYENTEWSISKRITDEFGIKYDSAISKRCLVFGKVLVKKYREIHDCDPPKRSQFVQGTVRSVNCYFLNDWIEFGDDLLKDYFKDVIVVDEEEE